MQTEILVRFVKKLLEIPFFQYLVCDQRRDEEAQFFGEKCIQQKGEVKTPSIPIHSLSGTSLSPHNENLEEGALFAYCNIWKERVRVFSFKVFTACKVKDEKEVANCIASHKNGWLVSNRFKHKLFSVITQFSVTVTILYFL